MQIKPNADPDQPGTFEIKLGRASPAAPMMTAWIFHPATAADPLATLVFKGIAQDGADMWSEEQYERAREVLDGTKLRTSFAERVREQRPVTMAEVAWQAGVMFDAVATMD